MQLFLQIKQAFSEFDSKDRGFLSYHDFSKAIKHLGMKLKKKQRAKLAEFVDVDKSESISINEFERAFTITVKGIDTSTWVTDMISQVRRKLHQSKYRLRTAFRL